MKEDPFLNQLRKIIPELVYSNSLLDSESIEIPIYYMVDDEGNVKIDYEEMQREFNNKLKVVLMIANPEVLE